MAEITLPITKARKDFLGIIDNLDKTFTRYTITKKGIPKAILMSYEEYESWLETLDILSDNELVKALNEALDDKRKGRISSYGKVVGKKQKGVNRRSRER